MNLKKSSIVFFLATASFAFANEEYNSGAYCAQCHEYIFEQNQNAPTAKHHFFANKYLSEKNISGFVPEQKIKYFDLEYRFYKEEEKFKFDITQNNQTKTYLPTMAIGVTPLLQYVTAGERGAFQVLSMAYDPENKEYFEIFGDENRQPNEWGHWTRQGMNWNANCAYCHTTLFEKNYDVKNNSYDSKYLSQGVTCLSCHSQVSENCKSSETFLKKTHEAMTNEQYMMACASCHSRREELTANKFRAGDNYFDHFRPALPDTAGVYYPDGQVRDEDFMYSSFMMCRQFVAGITCRDCHDSHSLRKANDIDKNQLCLGCHAPNAHNTRNAPTIDEHAHSRHGDNEGNLCVNCHMPKTTYMGRDSRYDHGFTSPDPYLTKYANTPNACTTCHDKIDQDKPERTLDWMLSNFNDWYKNDRFNRKRQRAYMVNLAYSGSRDIKLKNALLKLAKEEDISAWKSTLLNLLSHWIDEADVYAEAVKCLEDESPLVRASAVRLLALSQNENAKNLLEKMLKDKVRLVRVDAAFALRRELNEKTQEIQELIEYLDFNTDRPIGALKRADLSLAQNNIEDARFFAKHATIFEEGNEGLLNESAIMLYRAGDKDGALKLLQDALQTNPNSPQVCYSLALFYSENNDIQKTILYLERATDIDENFVRAWYNLSLAYLQAKDYQSAVACIVKATQLEPENQEFKDVQNYVISEMSKNMKK